MGNAIYGLFRRADDTEGEELRNEAVERAGALLERATASATQARDCVTEARNASQYVLDFAENAQANRGTEVAIRRAAAEAARIAVQAAQATVTFVAEAQDSAETDRAAFQRARTATHTTIALQAADAVRGAAVAAANAARAALAEMQVALAASQAETGLTETRYENLCNKNKASILALIGVLITLDLADEDEHKKARHHWWTFCIAASLVNVATMFFVAACTFSKRWSKHFSPTYVEKAVMVSLMATIVDTGTRSVLLNFRPLQQCFLWYGFLFFLCSMPPQDQDFVLHEV